MRALRSFGFALAVLLGAACSSNNIVKVVGHGGMDDPDGSDGDGGAMTTDEAGGGGTDGGPIGPLEPTSGVNIIVEPNGNGGSEIVAAINAATKSVHVVMYLFSSTDVEQALIAKQKAGLDVKVMLNQTFPTGESNQSMFNDLQANKVPVDWAPISLTHEKCIIIDGTTAWIMTMNTTVTSPTANREYLAIDHDLDDVVEAEAIFEADYAHTTAPVMGKLVVAPVNARARLLTLINSATTTLDIEGEEFSDPALTDAITARADAGVKVRLIVADIAFSSGQTASIADVKNHKGKAVKVTTPYIHAKAMIADGKQMYVGSANFSAASLGYNRELGLITETASQIALVAAAINKDFAAGTAL